MCGYTDDRTLWLSGWVFGLESLTKPSWHRGALPAVRQHWQRWGA